MCACGTADPPRGVALVIVMMVMAVLLLAGTTFLTISSTESQIAHNELAAAQALALAESGVERAILRLNANPGYTGEAEPALGNGRFQVVVSTAAAQGCPGNPARTLLATGAVPVAGGEARAQVQAVADKISYVFRWAAFSTVANGIVGGPRVDQEVLLGANTRVDSFNSLLGPSDPAANHGSAGDIGAKGDVWIGSGSTVAGSVRAGDQVTRSGATITGGQLAGIPGTRQPHFPWIAPPSSASAPPAISGSYQLAPGDYVWSSLTLPANTVLTAAGTVNLYIAGPVTIGDAVRIGAHPATQIKVFLKSDGPDSDAVAFTAGRDFTFYGALYGRNADVVVGDGAQIHGALVARTVALGSASSVHYDQALQHQPMCNGDGSTGTSTSGRYALRHGTWREVVP